MKEALEKILRKISRLVFPKFVLVGLDIQDKHVAGVATLRHGDKISILSSGVYDIPETSIEHGEISDPAPVRTGIKALLGTVPAQHFKFTVEPVFVLSIPSHKMYTETVVFPEMDAEELKNAVMLKAEASLPWPIEDAHIDWTSTYIPEKEEYIVFIVAVNKKTIRNYLQITSGERWRVGAIEFHILSLAKFVDQASVPSFIFALIDEDGIEFAVFFKGVVVAHFLHPVAGEEEAIKVLEGKIRQLTSFVESNLKFSIERIFVFDRVNREGVISSIHTITGIPTQPFLPDSRPAYSDPRLLIAHGAAFRPYAAADLSMNLIPSEFGGRYQENLSLRTLNLWIKILFVYTFSFLLAFASMFAFLKYQNATLSRDIQNQSAIFERLIPQSQPIIDEAQKFNALVDAFRAAKNLRTVTGKRIAAIIKISGETGVGATSLSSANDGIAGVFTAPSRDSILEFKRRMESQKIVTEVSIPLTDLAPEKNLTVNALLRL